MLKRPGLMAALWCCAALVQAQAPDKAPDRVPAPFVGTWKVTWEGKSRPLTAEMVLTESGGHWQTFNVGSKTNSCSGRTVPIAVKSASADAVALQLRFSEVINGCDNVSVKLQRGADGAITGTRSGEPLTLVKQ
ncbi:MAG: hypothetical protein U1F53_16990 [Burkholderiaceae bacterium]